MRGKDKSVIQNKEISVETEITKKNEKKVEFNYEPYFDC